MTFADLKGAGEGLQIKKAMPQAFTYDPDLGPTDEPGFNFGTQQAFDGFIQPFRIPEAVDIGIAKTERAFIKDLSIRFMVVDLNIPWLLTIEPHACMRKDFRNNRWRDQP